MRSYAAARAYDIAIMLPNVRRELDSHDATLPICRPPCSFFLLC
jgi:hypothetical protein